MPIHISDIIHDFAAENFGGEQLTGLLFGLILPKIAEQIEEQLRKDAAQQCFGIRLRGIHLRNGVCNRLGDPLVPKDAVFRQVVGGNQFFQCLYCVGRDRIEREKVEFQRGLRIRDDFVNIGGERKINIPGGDVGRDIVCVNRSRTADCDGQLKQIGVNVCRDDSAWGTVCSPDLTQLEGSEKRLIGKPLFAIMVIEKHMGHLLLPLLYIEATVLSTEKAINFKSKGKKGDKTGKIVRNDIFLRKKRHLQCS